MNNKEKMFNLISSSKNGLITTKEVTDSGIHRGELRNFIDNGHLTRYSRGIYTINSQWEDDFLLLQKKYKRGIYSHETALYLQGYSDSTPIKYTMTFPKGYNTLSLKSEDLIIKRTIPEFYSFGKEKIKSPSGNIITVYDLEKTLCDIARNKDSDIQIEIEAFKRYASNKNQNINKLIQYAEKLHIKGKVVHYMEVLL